MRIGDETRSHINGSVKSRIRMTSEITDHHQQKSSKCGFDMYRESEVLHFGYPNVNYSTPTFVKPEAEEDSCVQIRSSGLSSAVPACKDERRLLTAHGCSPRYAVRFETRPCIKQQFEINIQRKR